jgi:hypothetical protein
MATASWPCRARIAPIRRSISSNASAQETGCQPSAVRRNGWRRRSGSSCRSLSATAFGQMCPALSTSARSGLMERISGPRCSMTMPHIASQIEQVR